MSFGEKLLTKYDMDIPCLKNLNYLFMGEIINITIFYILGKQLKNEQSLKKGKKGENTNSGKAYI